MVQYPLVDLFNIDPLAELRSLREAMRQMMEAGWPLPRDFMPAAMAAVIVPVDILDTGPDLIVQTNLPGVLPGDLKLSVTGQMLSIRGNVEAPADVQGAEYLRRERRATSFYRSVVLPIDVDADKAEAHFANGVLTLTLPKAEKIRPKSIRIQQK